MEKKGICMSFISKLKYSSVRDLLEIFSNGFKPKGFFIYDMVNEVKPIDLYCYLYAKYGPPNGMQNMLRNNSSDNLIHWEWTFFYKKNMVSIQSHSTRTEIHFIGEYPKIPELSIIISEIKNDLKNYGNAIKEVRLKLEKWTRYVNPFNRLQLAVNQTIKNIDKLNLDVENDREKMALLTPEGPRPEGEIEELLSRYNNAVCYYFSLKSMLPVMAESFVNLVIYILARKEIKDNDRHFQSVIRQQIDIRVQSLHINCVGFKEMIDYTSDACKKFHTIINERNDILHGNMDLKNLKIGEIYFNRTVPIFTEYDDFYSRTSGVYLNSIKYDSIMKDYESINEFISYIIEKLEPSQKMCIEQMVFRREIGINSKDGRLGALLPNHMSDFRTKNKP
jgi:FtsZ-binding cell division protein ZapB